MLFHIAGIGLLLTSWLPFATPAVPKVPNRIHAVCSAASGETAACQAKIYAQADGSVKPAVTRLALPAGLSPAQLRSAYSVPAGTGRVAVVIAYDNPYAKSDLDTYSKTFGLPVLPNCTNSVTTSCFNKVNQSGKTQYPAPNRGWAFESSLDVQTVHGLCPACRIDLVEAKSASIANLMIAVDQAVAMGNTVVSMSWGAGEFASETTYSQHFANPNVQFVASSGDSGYGTLWPSASSRVISAGGTTLTLDAAGQRASETVWNGSGSGCSAYEPKPVWQTDTGCARRTTADIAAVADPATGAAIYSSYNPYGRGWYQIGGTSLSAPIIASLVALAGGGTQSALMSNLYSPASAAGRYDITAGSNGTCAPSYLCTGGPGYDGPTGMGAPIGLSAL